MQQKISKKIELIIKVLYKEEGEEEKKGIIPFCLPYLFDYKRPNF
jgi:hypothetical protein